MPRNTDDHFADVESEARFRGYLEAIPTFVLDPPDTSWMNWICETDAERAMFLYFYRKFGVDATGKFRANPPDREKRLLRRWHAASHAEIAATMNCNVSAVKAGIRKLEQKGLLEVTSCPTGGRRTPHFCMNWDRILQALLEAVKAKDQFTQFENAMAEARARKTGKQPAVADAPKKSQTGGTKRKRRQH